MKGAPSVALIEPVGGHGGMDYYDLGLSRGLIAAGWNVSWYTCPETPAPQIAGLTFHPVFKGIWGKKSRLVKGYRYLLGSLATLSTAVFSGQKICHFHFFHGSPEELLLLTLAKICGRRTVITVHDVESFANEGAPASSHIRKVYGLADRFIVHNTISRTELITRLNAPPEKISIIPHGNYVDTITHIPSPQDAKRTLGIDPSRKVVLFFGQIKEVKGVDLLLESMPAVIRAFPDVMLVIAGRPWKNDFSQYESLIQSLGIEASCTLHIRFVSNEEVSLYYAAAEIVVLPYRRIYQSGVILLAMSYAKAVLVSDLPGMTEIVTDGQNGYVFSKGSSASLSDSLIKALADEDGRKHVSQSALQYVETHHDWMKIGQSTAAVYSTLL